MVGMLLIILTLIIYFGIKYLNHFLITKNKIPSFINYKPFNCEICSTFWYTVGVFIVLGLTFNYIFLSGIIISILDAIAQKVNEKNKTIKL